MYSLGFRGPTIVYWGYIGIMEKKMETTIMGSMTCAEAGLSSGCCLVSALFHDIARSPRSAS